MSVQAGVWNFDGKPVDAKLLDGISDSVRHQGPDGEFRYTKKSLAMLYRPFHTTAESRREKQPYFSRRRFILTWDGRLDNREELIAELRHDLRSEPTDVAIVAAAFDRWESHCFRHFFGDWAVSVWKPKEHELIFAIDYMAIRHIFYYLQRDKIWWSTDLAPLVLLSGDQFHVDERYVSGYFANEPDAHLTPYAEIREVPAGQFVVIRKGSAVVERYWRFSPRSRIRYKTDGEYEEHFRHVFRQSVRRRLRSDSPILAELSGGLDSSSIVCMADDILAKQGAQTTRLDTLSFYDKTEPLGDDWSYFPKIEEKRGRVGAHIDVGKLGIAATPLEYTQFNPLPGYLGYERNLEIERAAIVRSGGYTRVLSGIGGDEFLGGVPDPTAHLADLIVQFKLVKLGQQLIAWSLVKRRPWSHLLWQALTDLLPPSLGQYFIQQARVEPWLNKNFAGRTQLAARALDVDEHFGMLLPTRRSLTAGVLLMARKLAKWRPPLLALEEICYPYLDQDLIEFVLSIPANQLLRPGERRSLMRRALFGIVPEKILSRRTKHLGARTPVVMLEKNMPELQAAFRLPISSNMGYINAYRFLEVVGKARNGIPVPIARLLRAVSLEFWLRDMAFRRLIDPSTLGSSTSAATSRNGHSSHAQIPGVLRKPNPGSF